MLLSGQCQKKNFDIHKVGDIIFVKKEKANWILKQYPIVNGGIVVIDPYNGNVKALVGGFLIIDQVNLIE